jgi:putative tricarboxylic transport membrane protein
VTPLEGLAYGFSVALTPLNIGAALLGAVLGTLVGVLPGIGPVGAMALLLPITLQMPPETALIMLAAIYYGSMYGGSTTSILLNVPGEAASVITTIEGYQLARRGRAGAALAVAAVGSFVAGSLGVVGLMLFAPALSSFALSFGVPEFFSLALLGLVALSRVSGGRFWPGILTLSLGLAVATVGLDPISGQARFTFGLVELQGGIGLVPAVMGLYGIAEVLSVAEQAGGLPGIRTVRWRELFPSPGEWRRAAPAIIRGTAVGFFVGLIPGPSTVLSTFVSYNLERRLNRRAEFGRGAIEGVAGPESANNAATSGAMVPMLSLGIPFSPATAMLLAALLVQGVRPGPLLVKEHPEIFWGVVASMYVGNAALLILNLPLVGLWASVLRIPQAILLTGVLLLTLVGAYSVDNSLLDLLTLMGAGLAGYLFRKVGFDPAPLVLALVLGPVLENSFRQSLFMSQGSLLIFIQRPISALLLGLALLVLGAPALWGLRAAHKDREEAESV